MYKRETFDLEFKEKITRTFLKTVSAFSNYNDGKIIFGMSDKGVALGLDRIDDECLKIENMINDSIEPMPDYRIDTEVVDGAKLIVLRVYKGRSTPYYYKDKAYRRSDSATVEVDRLELGRLILEGINLNYEEMKSTKQDLEFTLLEKKLKETAGINEVDLDVLKTLNLYNKDGYYNIAGEVLADENTFMYSGIDIVRFGEGINQILDRETLVGKSLLWQHDRALEMFERYYTYEEIVGYRREKKELIPEKAYREALANAIIHRVWDLRAHVSISMFSDRIEIVSPGGLPAGISEEDYLNKNISMLRNPIIAGVFLRLRLIEQFGTGIARILGEYRKSLFKPSFNISENSIGVTLPLLEENQASLSEEEKVIYSLFRGEVEVTRRELEEESGFSKWRTLRIINDLLGRGLIKKFGQGPGTSYRRS